ADIEAMLGMKRHVRHAERLRQHFRLIVEAGTWEVVRDFLEQGEVRAELTQGRDHPFETVLPIDAPNTLVDVPGDDAKPHWPTKKTPREDNSPGHSVPGRIVVPRSLLCALSVGGAPAHV